MPPRDRLPTEILEAVIDRCREDIASLRHLSLTCHVFLPRARYHLFSTVVLRTPLRADSFRDFLDTHQWVGPIVQTLVHSSAVPDSDSKATTYVCDAVPIHLLSRLPNLHSLRMGIPELDGGQRAVWLHSGSGRPSYSSCIRNLEVASVYFKNTSAFMELLSMFPGVHTLTCSSVWIKSSTTGIALESRSPSQLRSLRVCIFDHYPIHMKHARTDHTWF